ncbi:MAG: hypothetical protein WBF43_01040 [Methylocella sp.]
MRITGSDKDGQDQRDKFIDPESKYPVLVTTSRLLSTGVDAQTGRRSPIPKQHQWRAWAANPEGITGDELLSFVNGGLFPAPKNLTISTQPGDRRRMVKDMFEDAYNYMKSGQLMRQVVNCGRSSTRSIASTSTI